MEPLITTTAELILPGDTLDVLAYACIGIHSFRHADCGQEFKCRQARSKNNQPGRCRLSAFNALGAKRIAVLTPYAKHVNDMVQKSLKRLV